MYDATPLQCIAHGTVKGSPDLHPTFVAQGVSSIIRKSMGRTVITLDFGVSGGGAIPIEDSRVTIQPLNTDQVPPLPFPLSVESTVHKGFGPNGASTFTVQIWVSPAEPVDIDYDFIIWKAGQPEPPP